MAPRLYPLGFSRSLLLAGFCALAGASGCNRSHWAEVEVSPLPTPPGEKVAHTGRLVVAISPPHQQNQCVVYQKMHPVCFFNIRPALERGLLDSLWPSFREVVAGPAESARPEDYLLQVEVTLDALPPDVGPGWSAGARSRFRLLRDGQVLAEQTLASRSRPHFAYGAPLGEGATEVVDATIITIAQAVSRVPETRAAPPVLLPRVAVRTITPSGSDRAGSERAPSEQAATASMQAPPPPLDDSKSQGVKSRSAEPSSPRAKTSPSSQE